MATAGNLRFRRNHAQLHALAGVEREIRAADPGGRRKYLLDFTQSFNSYKAVINSGQLRAQVRSADIVLVSDYHALPACQRFAATLLEERAQPGDRPVVLGVETIFSRDQHILDEWWRREIDEAELRQRIRFDLDWGYDWTPFHELLVCAREHADAIYGLDCMPREDLRKIAARDRHAAHKIGEIRQRHPDAAIVVLFGESHLAPAHLPLLVRQQLPQQRILTVLQNVDALYWQAAGEKLDHVDAVQVCDDTVCVFNSTPPEKYENYRLHLSRWSSLEGEGPDVAPTIYNLIDSLLRFLDINRYSSRNGTQPKFLVDLLPEVHSSVPRLRRLVEKEASSEEEQQTLLHTIEERGSVYLPSANAFYVHNFQMMYAAEEAARFLHSACRGLPSLGRLPQSAPSADRFHAQILERALGYFGSRVLYPARLSEKASCDLSRTACEDLLRAAMRDPAQFDVYSQQIGYALGSDLYDQYLAGSLSPSRMRRLFFAHIEEPGVAQKLCAELIRNRGPLRKPPQFERRRHKRDIQSSTA